MDKRDWGLREIPQVASYQGMIFGNLDKNAMSLEDYLGDMKWYMDIMLGRSDGGMEVRGIATAGLQKQIGKVRLRTLLPIHTMSKRPIAQRLKWELAPKILLYAGYGHQVVMENGHGINVITSKTGKALLPFQSTPESMWPMFKKNLTPEQLDIQRLSYSICLDVSKSLFCEPDSWDKRSVTQLFKL